MCDSARDRFLTDYQSNRTTSRGGGNQFWRWYRMQTDWRILVGHCSMIRKDKNLAHMSKVELGLWQKAFQVDSSPHACTFMYEPGINYKIMVWLMNSPSVRWSALPTAAGEIGEIHHWRSMPPFIASWLCSTINLRLRQQATHTHRHSCQFLSHIV